MAEKAERNSNIEFLRIILMFMVILLHFNNREMGGALNYVSKSTLNKSILYLFESLSICAVNCFMIISGYFLAFNRKVKLGRIVDLLLVVIFYNFFDFFLSMIVESQAFSIKSFILCFIPGNYFAIFYCVTYLLSPYIVLIFDSLDEKQKNRLLLILILVFTLVSTGIDFLNNLTQTDYFNRISTISSSGDIGGYTIVQFLLAFIVGIWLRRKDFRLKNSILIPLYLILSFLMTILANKLSSVYAYSTLFTFANGIILFLIFNNFEFHNKFINFVSKSVFPIFCIHTSGSMLSIWRKFLIKSEYFDNSLQLLICMIISVTAMFIFCFFIDIIFKLLFGKIKNFICNKMPLIINLEKTEGQISKE